MNILFKNIVRQHKTGFVARVKEVVFQSPCIHHVSTNFASLSLKEVSSILPRETHLEDSEASPSILFGSHSGSSLSPSDTPIDSIPRHQPR